MCSGLVLSSFLPRVLVDIVQGFLPLTLEELNAILKAKTAPIWTFDDSIVNFRSFESFEKISFQVQSELDTDSDTDIDIEREDSHPRCVLFLPFQDFDKVPFVLSNAFYYPDHNELLFFGFYNPIDGCLILRLSPSFWYSSLVSFSGQRERGRGIAALGGHTALLKLRRYVQRILVNREDQFGSYRMNTEIESPNIGNRDFDYGLRLLVLYLLLKSKFNYASLLFRKLAYCDCFTSFKRNIAELDDHGLWTIATDHR